MKKLSSKPKAFTLIEVLIALFIFSVVVFGALQVFNFIQNTSKAGEKKVERLRELQLALYKIEDDVRYLIPRIRRNQYSDKEPLLQSENDGTSAYIEFTRTNWRNPVNLPRSELQHLKYELINDQLVRHHWMYVDNALEDQQLSRVMLNDVEQLQFEFFVEDDWKQEWMPGTESLSNLPEAIKVTIVTKDFGEIYRLLPLTNYSRSTDREDSEREQNG